MPLPPNNPPEPPVVVAPQPPTEPPVVVAPQPPAEPPVVVAPQPPATHQIHRLRNSNGDHMLSRDPAEGSQFGYIHEGLAFNALANAGNDTKPIYRCSHIVNGNRGDHFTSNEPQCEGKTSEGLLGYLYANQIANTIAVYRCNNPYLPDHMTTTDRNECNNNGYIVEGAAVLGYAPQ